MMKGNSQVTRVLGLLVGVAALVMASWAGIHFTHILDEGGTRHAGETVVAVAIAVALFLWARRLNAKGRSSTPSE